MTERKNTSGEIKNSTNALWTTDCHGENMLLTTSYGTNKNQSAGRYNS